MSEENTFYVFNIGGRKPARIYHRGCCRWVKLMKDIHHTFLINKQKADVRYYREGGGGPLLERTPCSECRPEIEDETNYHYEPQIPFDRVPQGSCFFVSLNGSIYHESPDCDILQQEVKGGRAIYGFVNAENAEDLDVYRDRRAEFKRKPCHLCASATPPKPKPAPAPAKQYNLNIKWKYLCPCQSGEPRELSSRDITLSVDGRAQDKITVTAGIPSGEHKIFAEIYGNDDLISAATVTAMLDCDKTGVCGHEFSARLEIKCLPKEIWPPEKLHDFLTRTAKGRAKVPENAWCTPNIAWRGLLIGIGKPPGLEVLENLVRVARVIEDYRKSLFEYNPVEVVNGWRALEDPTPETSPEARLRAQGLAVDFKVKNFPAPQVQVMLAPFHAGGLGIPHNQTYIDLRPYVARLDRDFHLDLLYPTDCQAIPILTDEMIENAFGKVLKTRKIPKAAIPPRCHCATYEGDPAKGELPKCVPVDRCSCLRPLPKPKDESFLIQSLVAGIDISEDEKRKVSQSVTMPLFAEIRLISDQYGEGATNFKHYAFYGAFINRAKFGGFDMVKKLGERGFSETWLVRMPLSVEMSGDFEIVSLPSADPDDVKNHNRLVLRSVGHNFVFFDKINFSGIPETMAPANGEFIYNTAGGGEAHGDSGEASYHYAGMEVSFRSETDPAKWPGAVGDFNVSYFYSFGQSEEKSAGLAFSLNMAEVLA
jgi:hypothetical protein